MYPLLKDGVTLGQFVTERDEPAGFFAENAQGETFEISEELYHLLLKADGTHAVFGEGMSPARTGALLRRLKQAGILTTSRLQPGFPFSRFLLLPVGKRGARLKGPCAALNRALPWVCLMMTAAGVTGLGHALERFPLEGYLCPATVALFLCCLALHEAGHFCAAVAYDCEVSDVGVLLVGLLPVGAYVCHSTPPESRAEHVQLTLAGVEMNLVLMGLFSLLTYLPGAPGEVFAVVCLWNLMVTLLNLLPTAGLDGEAAISAWLELPSFGDFVTEVLRRPETRSLMLHGGLEGLFWLGVCLLQLLSRVVLVLLFLFGFGSDLLLLLGLL